MPGSSSRDVRPWDAFVLAARRLWEAPWSEEDVTMTHKTDATGFPDVLRNVSAERLLEAYAAGPARIRAALDGLSPSQLAEHPVRGKWSIAEIILHLADAEIMGAARIRQAVAEPGSTAAVYDQDRWAAGLAYGDRGPDAVEEALQLFELLRRTSLPLFARVRGGGNDESVVHPGWGGPLTVRQLLELYADHSERHLAQMLERRRLVGAPLDMDLLLPDRLY